MGFIPPKTYYSGKYIARRLLSAGRRVITLTNSPKRPDPFRGEVEPRPYDFDRPKALIESLRGAEVLYNTYGVRFNHRRFSHLQAVENTLTLFERVGPPKNRKMAYES